MHAKPKTEDPKSAPTGSTMPTRYIPDVETKAAFLSFGSKQYHTEVKTLLRRWSVM